LLANITLSVIESRVLVELKAVSILEQAYIGKTLNYLHVPELAVCFLTNFGTIKVQIKGFLSSVHWISSLSFNTIYQLSNCLSVSTCGVS